MSDFLAPAEEEALFERVVRNQLLIKELTEENDRLKSFTKGNPDAYPVGSTRNVGKFYIKVTKNARVDDSLARSVLGELVYKTLTKEVIDSAKAKRGLSASDYEKIQKVYEPKIEIGLN